MGDRVEIVLPVGMSLEPMESDEGKIEEIENAFWLTLKKIVSTKGKEFQCIHSGDLNDIILPVKLPSYTILRRGIAEAKAKKGLI